MITILISIIVCSCGGGDDNTIDATAGAPDAAETSGDAAPEGTCRDNTACADDESCIGPNDTNCGIPPQEGCSDIQGCANGDACHAIPDSCSPDGVGSMCGPACAPGDDCGDGFACAPDGACRPIPCDQPGHECRPSETCDTASIDLNGAVHEITHGCVTVPCTDDNVCANDTVCVNGYCQAGPGMCSLPAP